MPKIDFKALKDRVSLKDILDHYGILEKLNQKGQSLRGKCPLHDGDNETSFSVSLEKNAWHCFGGCGGGNQLDFVSKRENVPVFEAAKKIVEWFSIDDLKQETGSKKKTQPKKEVEQPAEQVGRVHGPGTSSFAMSSLRTPTYGATRSSLPLSMCPMPQILATPPDPCGGFLGRVGIDAAGCRDIM